MQKELNKEDLYSHDVYIRTLAIANFADYLRFLNAVDKLSTERLESIIEMLMSKDKDSINLGIELMITIWEEFKI